MDTHDRRLPLRCRCLKVGGCDGDAVVVVVVLVGRAKRRRPGEKEEVGGRAAGGGGGRGRRKEERSGRGEGGRESKRAVLLGCTADTSEVMYRHLPTCCFDR